MDKKPVKIIFDTDIGGDCDDAGALAVLHRLCDLGEAELLAVTACYSSPYVAGCIDAINTYHHRLVPIGMLPGKTVPGEWVYSGALYKEFPHHYPAGREVPDTVRLIREILSKEEDNSVTLVGTGTMASLGALLDSPPDDISSLSGYELIRQKLDRTVIMGGRFFGTWPYPMFIGDPRIPNAYEVREEFNIRANVPCSRAICERWPGEIVFTSYEIAAFCMTMSDYNRNGPKDDPVRRSYEICDPQCLGRCSWDLTAIVEAVRPNAGYWNYHEYGKVTVDDKGRTDWYPAKEQDGYAGKRTYLLPRKDNEEIQKLLEDLVYLK